MYVEQRSEELAKVRKEVETDRAYKYMTYRRERNDILAQTDSIKMTIIHLRQKKIAHAKLKKQKEWKQDAVKSNPENINMVDKTFKEGSVLMNRLNTYSDIGITLEVKQRKLIKVVKKEEIVDIAHRLSFSLCSKNVEFKEVLKIIRTKGSKELQKVSIKHLLSVFQKNPFCIKDYQEAQLLARYIIEDNYYDKIEYDDQNNADMSVISSVCKTLFGRYKVLKNEEEKLC